MIDMMNEETKPTISVMSKKRLEQIKEMLSSYLQESEVEEAISKICEIMKFSPDYAKHRYSAEMNKKHQEWRYKKAEELGVSVSMIANGKYKRRLEQNKST